MPKVRFTPALVDPADFLAAYAPGDYDRNEVVNAADYDKWKTDFGSSVVKLGDGADGNRDGTVDTGDYTVWRDAFQGGEPGEAAGESVPEATAAVSLSFGCLTALGRGGRRPRC